jgi:glycosyltransferase involved in cell wall biosynthesis
MQVSRPAVSIVVPLYNKASYILRCLKSIQRQTFTDFEVIVVNDGSTDGSGDLAAGLRDPRFTVTHQDNQGSGAARNRGIALAQAGLIAFLDADDTWDENFLAAIAGLAKEFPEAGVFASGYRRCFGRGLDREVTLRTPPGTHTRLLADYLSIGRRGGCLTCSSVAIRRDLLTRVGGFIEGHPLGEDQDLWVRLSLLAPIAYDSRILAVYHSEANGRICRVFENEVPPIPPAVYSLRVLLSEGAVPEDRRREMERHIEWLLFNHVVKTLYSASRSDIKALLRAAPFKILRYQVGGGLISFALLFFPARVLAALKLKTATFVWGLRNPRVAGRLLNRVDRLTGSALVVRAVRSIKMPEDLEPTLEPLAANPPDVALTRQ